MPNERGLDAVFSGQRTLIGRDSFVGGYTGFGGEQCRNPGSAIRSLASSHSGACTVLDPRDRMHRYSASQRIEYLAAGYSLAPTDNLMRAVLLEPEGDLRVREILGNDNRPSFRQELPAWSEIKAGIGKMITDQLGDRRTGGQPGGVDARGVDKSRGRRRSYHEVIAARGGAQA